MKITQIPIPKHYQENNIKAVVFHVDLGTKKGTTHYLKNIASASYHFYLPRKRDEIIQFVQVERGAWHSGVKSNPIDQAVKLFGNESVNKQSVSICYEGLPVDKRGKYTSNWSKVVNGQKANDNQVAKAVWLIKALGYEELPFFAHKDITVYKPECVNDFKVRVASEMPIIDNHVCSMKDFTRSQLLTELIKRF